MVDKSDKRKTAAQARRVVVKLGTHVLASKTGRPDARRIKQLVSDIAAQKKAGRELVVVSSGAVGMGMDALGLKTRPKTLPELQMAASVGQAKLVSYYGELFAKERITVGQVLLTHDVLNHRLRHLNARNAMFAMIRRGIIPIVNENDVVSVDEIRLGDNDFLAALTALLVDADLLVLLSTVDGLRRQGPSGRTSRIKYLSDVNGEALSLVRSERGSLSSGGMATKLESAQMVVSSGRLAVIADGRKSGVLGSVLAGEDVGTLIGGLGSDRGGVTGSRKRWIAFFHRARGSIVVDAGALRAISGSGKSLLPAGVVDVRGKFAAGDPVNILTEGDLLIARGLSDYSSEDISRIKGRRTSEIAAILGRKDYEEIVHRDNLVVL